MNRLNRERRAQGEQDRKALAKIDKAIAGIIAAIEDGMYQPSMKVRMDELERQKAEIIARQLQAPADTPDVHPNIGNIYRKRAERFADALHNDDDGRIAAEELRSLIEEVVLMPGEKRGEVHVKLRGELFGILDFVEAKHRQRPGEVRTKVAAGLRKQFLYRSIKGLDRNRAPQRGAFLALRHATIRYAKIPKTYAQSRFLRATPIRHGNGQMFA